VGKQRCPILCRERWQGEAARLWKRERSVWGDEGGEEREWTDNQAATLYKKALTEAAEIAGKSVSSGFEESRQKTVFEFGNFLAIIHQWCWTRNCIKKIWNHGRR
jgi:hypothetical protein